MRPCGVSDKSRPVSSAAKPFIIDKTVIRQATPNTIPRNETNETIQIKRLFPENKLYLSPTNREVLVNTGKDKTITQN